MAGIYIHIPFCKQACHYCNFHFSTSLRHRDDMVNAIISEIFIRKDFLDTQELSSIYFGGGTPSLLKADEIAKIMDALSDIYNWTDIEVTLEANPDDITHNKLSELHEAGINRLSIGVQSFIEAELSTTNRAHQAIESKKSIAIARDVGFDDISIDLIYGMPDSTHSSWQYNLDQAIDLQIPHISSYALTVEPRTALAHMVNTGTVILPSESIVRDQFISLVDRLQKEGYYHYEISNFAKEGQLAVHNTNYWRGIPYLGVGPSAHSYKQGMRSWNIANNAKYLESISQGRPPSEEESIRLRDQYNEYIMTGLRTMWGVKAHKIKTEYGVYYDLFMTTIMSMQHKGWVQQNGDNYTLTLEGKLLADRIASNLFAI